MATRTSRRGGSSTSHTPVVSSPAASRAGQRSPSPLSPARVSRLEEKRSIQNLNDRLCAYIDAVRSRDVEIANLKQERSTVEETHSVEITQVKNMYTHEMAQLRKALDQVSKDKAKLEIEAEKGTREAREAKSDLASKEKLLNATDRELKTLQAKYNEALNRANTAEADVKVLSPENKRLKEKLDDAKRNLEDETLKRVDLQNQLLSMEENLKFENQMLEKQLNETRVRRQIEISEIDGRAAEKYEKKLQEQIQQLRNSYEKQLADSQDEFAQKYDDKIAALTASLDSQKSNSAVLQQENRELVSKCEILKTQTDDLQRRLNDIKKEADDNAAYYRAELAKKESELRNKDEQLDATVKDYKDLMETKVALDMEIAVYRNLLEGEEARLGLSQPGSPEAEQPTGRGIKRKRTFIEEEDDTHMVSEHIGKGSIVVEPFEKSDNCIKVANRSEEPINIGGWVLSNTSDSSDGKEMVYKFPRNIVLGPGETCSIWSADSNQEHKAPYNLVMKKGGWMIGTMNKTILVNKDNEEESVRMSKEEHKISGTYSSRRGAIRSGEEKSCSIM